MIRGGCPARCAAAAGVGFAAAWTAFYADGIPLAAGLAGLACICVLRRRPARFALALGWHAAAFLPAALGLWNLEGGPAWQMVPLAAWLGAVAAAHAILNAGLAAAALALLPWHIGSAALAAGELWPGSGSAGIAGAVLLLAVLDTRRPRPAAVAAAVAAAASAACWLAHDPAGTGRLREHRTADAAALTTAGRERAVLEALPRVASVTFGENVVDAGAPGALDRWCGHAERLGATIHAGVLGRDGIARVFAFRPDGCGPAAVHERRVSVPGVRGSWMLGRGGVETVVMDGRPVVWMICFEVFSPVAWLSGPRPAGGLVAVAANDRWVRPLPVATARRKVARSMARLWNMSAVFADSGETVLLVPAPP